MNYPVKKPIISPNNQVIEIKVDWREERKNTH